MTRSRHSALALTALIASIAVGTASARAASFPFQPITMQRINLPSKITSARWPEFTKDGRHLLFWFKNEMWITSLAGNSVHCLSCGVANDPKLPGFVADNATPFPDGKRVFIEEDIQPGTSKMAVLDCEPSVVHCRNRKIVPVDFSGAEPAVIPPGGAVSTPQQTLVGAEYHAQLSQDGHSVGFSEIRSDAIEVMVVGKLQRSASGYVITGSRVINPSGPTSISDTNIGHWSDTGALYEFKAFTHGGADATYVEDGGPRLGSVYDWSVNLATGHRTLLASAPDWNEDNGGSPNGTLLSVFSDRTMHFVDWLGPLLPVRDFIEAPESAMAAGTIGGNTECMGPMWLLPSTGDDGGNLAGEPVVDYRYPGVHVADNLAAPSQWSPNGTMIALNTVDDPTGQAARFLLVAHLTAVKPSRPLPAVSSQPGSWAPTPAEYHPALGYTGTVTLHGPGGGTVTVTYPGSALSGAWAETYRNYSADGKDFVNGTVTITGGPLSGGTYSAHLTMTGTNTGNDNIDIDFTHGAHGHATSTYDGTRVTGPQPQQVNATTSGGPATACPSHLPRKPALHMTAKRLRSDTYRVKVTASIAGVGPYEASTDTEPVNHAAIRLGRTTTYTNTHGVAIVHLSRSGRLAVTAGDTLVPTHAHVTRPGRK